MLRLRDGLVLFVGLERYVCEESGLSSKFGAETESVYVDFWFRSSVTVSYRIARIVSINLRDAALGQLEKSSTVVSFTPGTKDIIFNDQSGRTKTWSIAWRRWKVSRRISRDLNRQLRQVTA